MAKTIPAILIEFLNKILMQAVLKRPDQPAGCTSIRYKRTLYAAFTKRIRRILVKSYLSDALRNGGQRYAAVADNGSRFSGTCPEVLAQCRKFNVEL
jgi:hypothetical protein